MFDIGFLELLVIAAMGLLVLGPERLPGVVKQVASWTARSRHFANNLKMEFEREANLGEMRESLHKQKARFEQEVSHIEDSLAVSDPEQPEASETAAQAKSGEGEHSPLPQTPRTD